MTCIIIEDQPPAQRILKKYIEDKGNMQLLATFPDALLALDFLKLKSVDLIFLDIHLPKISGFDFLKTLSHPPSIILTTAFSEYALESYEFNVTDYLLKPFSFQRFVVAVSKVLPESAVQQAKTAPENTTKEIYIKSGYDHIRIQTDAIFYIKSDTDYTEIVVSLKKHLSSETLRFWTETLDQPQFFRVHKSYIINTQKIQKISGNQIFLSDKIIIPIGRAYREEFRSFFGL